MILNDKQVRRLLARDTRHCEELLNAVTDHIDSISSRCSNLGEKNIAIKLEDIVIILYNLKKQLHTIWDGEPPLFDD